jgi:hypothetical protein
MKREKSFFVNEMVRDQIGLYNVCLWSKTREGNLNIDRQFQHCKYRATFIYAILQFQEHERPRIFIKKNDESWIFDIVIFF